jgi:4-amino-4-deoxy-L-arabinose transferase-like glycosyltransferase
VRLALITVGALTLRVVYILVVTRHDKLSLDQLYYLGSAVRVAHWDGFKTPPFYGLPNMQDALHPPLTAAVLAPMAWLTNGSALAMRFVVGVAGAATVALVGLVGREVAGPPVGLTAAAIAAIYPNLVANDGIIMPETFATLATAAVIFFTYRTIRTRSWTMAAAAGVACAAAMLSRSELALLLVCLVVPAVLLLRDTDRAQRLRLSAVAVLASAVVVAPWVGYNLARFERPVFLSYGEGATLLGANCKATYHGQYVGFWIGLCAPAPASVEPSVEAAKQRREAFHYIRGHIGRLPTVVAARVGRLWSVYRPIQLARFSKADGIPEWLALAGLAMFAVLVALAIGGGWLLARRSVPVLPLVAPAVVLTVVAAALYGRVRFRAPVEAPLVVLAAVAIHALWVRRTASSPSPVAVRSTASHR